MFGDGTTLPEGCIGEGELSKGVGNALGIPDINKDDRVEVVTNWDEDWKVVVASDGDGGDSEVDDADDDDEVNENDDDVVVNDAVLVVLDDDNDDDDVNVAKNVDDDDADFVGVDDDDSGGIDDDDADDEDVNFEDVDDAAEEFNDDDANDIDSAWYIGLDDLTDNNDEDVDEDDADDDIIFISVYKYIEESEETTVVDECSGNKYLVGFMFSPILSRGNVDGTAEGNMLFIADIFVLEEMECVGTDKVVDGNKLIVAFPSCEINFPVDITSCFDEEDK